MLKKVLNIRETFLQFVLLVWLVYILLHSLYILECFSLVLIGFSVYLMMLKGGESKSFSIYRNYFS